MEIRADVLMKMFETVQREYEESWECTVFDMGTWVIECPKDNG